MEPGEECELSEDIREIEINNIEEAETEDIRDMRSAALEYAKYLKSRGLKPGDITYEESEEDAPKNEDKVEEGTSDTEKKIRRRRKPLKVKVRPYEKRIGGIGVLSKIVDIKDAVQTGIDDTVVGMGKDFLIAVHGIADNYRISGRSIAAILVTIGIISTAILIIFDRFTVYEYAYNGKVLGYVKEQEEVTDVLEIAGEKLTENSRGSIEIKFEPNKNVTFNLVDSMNKSLDDSDTAINKLVYMTDIETEAYGVYDGRDALVAIVKTNEDAEELLMAAKNDMSRPDRGMTLVSSEFDNQLEVRPLNVLLTSVQDNESAREQMTKGGQMLIYHIVEEGETLESLASEYTVAATDIFDETNSEIALTAEKGDKVCIRKSVDPVSVTMVESGKMKESIEFKTVKQESDQFYKGDTYIQQEGRDGLQIFEGTITKTGGEVVERDGKIVEVSTPVRDKIILVGTAERPKSAPTGTYAMPIMRYTLTSGFGGRWGRLHRGLDMAAPTGTPIYASDGGTVIVSGVYGGYGYCIDIDHGNGRVTRYGHCSRLLVGVGEKVYQGQEIALVGSTGNSTGSHLHFEIMLDGTPVDPAPILGI